MHQPPNQSTSEPVVIVENLGKRYRRMHSDRPRTIMEAALAGFRKLRAMETFWALEGVSFAVMPGQMVGVLGHNGAGKSTLLQILSGIVKPDVGSVRVTGRMGALLDLGSGFHEDLTGRENVFINAIIGGLTRQEAEKRFDQILEFAELEDFIDNPLRTYSSGMQMRLGFAVAIHANPDVLFIDEFLSVGDLAFQAKCLDRIMSLKRDGCAIVLISQNAEQVQALCDQAIWLEQGQLKAYGDPEVVGQAYADHMEAKSNNTQAQRQQYSQEAMIQTVELRDRAGTTMTEINSGDPVTVAIDYAIQQPIEHLIVSIAISTADGQICFNTNTGTIGLDLPISVGSHQISLDLDRLDLTGGEYFINVGLYAGDWSFTYDGHWNLHPLTIGWTPPEQTLLYPPRRWSVAPPPPILGEQAIIPDSKVASQTTPHG
jgi:lipopolysaccharide transport system ATP-binding protein